MSEELRIIKMISKYLRDLKVSNSNKDFVAAQLESNMIVCAAEKLVSLYSDKNN